MEHVGGEAGDVFGASGILPIILEEIISPRRRQDTKLNYNNSYCLCLGGFVAILFGLSRLVPIY